MSKEIDERIVEMRFDNEHFEKNVQTSMSTLEKFKQQLRFKDAGQGFEDIDRAAKKVDLSPLGKSAEKISLKFRGLYTIADHELRKIMDAAEAYGKRIVSALTIDPIKTGLQEYETKVNAIQVIKANTRSKFNSEAEQMDTINSALAELNDYADRTIYNFAQMTDNVGKFVAQTGDVEKSVKAVQGLANLAGASGASAQDMARATYQMSQALSGTIRKIDWNSLRNANMATQELKNMLMDLAKVEGVDIDGMIAKKGTFEDTLEEGWLTGDMFMKAMNIYSDAYSEAELAAMGFNETQIANFKDIAKTAKEATTEVKTFTQLFDVLKETAQSGWTQTWEIVFGDFNTAKKMFTEAQVYFSNILNGFSDARNMLLGGALNLDNPWSKIFDKIGDADFGGTAIKFKEITDEQLKQAKLTENEIALYRSLADEADRTGTTMLQLVDDMSKNSGRTMIIDSFKNAWSGLVSILKAVRDAWVDIFPPMTSVQLYNIIAAIKDFSEKLLVSDETSKKLTKTFKGLFAIVDVIVTLISSTVKVSFKALNKLLEVFNIDLLSISASIGDVIVDFRDCVDVIVAWIDSLKDSKNLPEDIAKGIASGLGKIAGIVTGWFKTLGSGLQNGFSGVSDNIISGLVKGLWNGIKLVGQVIYELGEILIANICEVLGIHSPSTEFASVGENTILGLMEGIKNTFPVVLDTIGACALMLIDTITNLIRKIDWGTIFQGVMTAMSSILVFRVSSVIKSFGKMFDGVADILGNTADLIKDVGKGVKGALDGIKTMFTDFGKSQVIKARSQAFKSLASSLLTLAIALAILAFIPTDRLIAATAAISVMAIVLGGLLKLVTNSFTGEAAVDKQLTKNIRSMTLTLIGISAAMLILAKVCKDLGSLSWSEMGRAVTGLAVITGITAALLAMIKSLNTSDIGKKVLQLAALTIFVSILAGIVVILSHIDSEAALESTLSLITLMGAMTALMYVLSATKVVMKNALTGLLGLTLMVIPLGAFALSLANLPTVSGKEKDILILVGVMGAMTLLLAATAGVGAIYAATSFIAATGILALALMVGPLWAFAGSLAGLPTIENKEKDIQILMGVIAAMTGILVVVSVFGPLASMGIIALAEMSLFIVAFGAFVTGVGWLFDKFPDLQEFLDTGIPILEQMAYGLGSVISSFGSGLISSLPEIGTTLTDFMDNIEGFVEGVKMMDRDFLTSVGLLVNAFMMIGFVDTAAIFKTILSGGKSPFESFGEGLSDLGELLTDFAKNTDSFTDKDLDNVKRGAEAITVIAKAAATIPNQGGVVSWFAGDNTIGGFIKMLVGDGDDNPGINALMRCLSNSPFDDSVHDKIDAITDIIIAMVDVSNSIPNQGGVASWFAGDNTIGRFIKMIIGDKDNPGINALMKTLSASPLDTSASDKIDVITDIMTAMVEAANDIPNQGGVASWFAGDNTIGGFIKMIIGDKDNPGINALMRSISASPYDKTMSGKIKIISDIITSMVDASSNISNKGGVASWFAGDNTIGSFIKMIVGDKDNPGVNALMRSLSASPYDETMTGKVGIIVDLLQGISDASNIIPNQGGVTSWFAGDNTIGGFIKMIIGDKDNPGINALMRSLSASPYDKTMSDKVNTIVDLIVGLAEGSNEIANRGGVASWFSGDNSLKGFIEQINGKDGNPGIKELMATLSEVSIDDTTSGKVTAIVDLIVGLAEGSQKIANRGGVASWFAGDNSLKGFIEQIKGKGDNPGIKDMMDSLSDITIDENTSAKVKTIVDIFYTLADASSKIKSPKNIATFGKNIVGFADNFIKFTEKVSIIKTETISASIAKINELIELCSSITADKIDAVSDFGDALKNIASGGIDKFIKTISSDSSVKSAKDAINTFLTNTSNKIKADDIKKTFSTIGKYIVQGVAVGIDTNSYLVSDAVRTVVENAKLAAQEEAEIQSPSLVFNKEVGRYIVQGIAEGIKEDTSAEEAIRIKMGNLYSAYLDLKKNWKGESPLPNFYGFATQNKLVSIDRGMRADAKAAGMSIADYVEHMYAEAYLNIQSNQPVAKEKAIDAIMATYQPDIDSIEAKKKKNESNYNWSKLSSTFGMSDAAENKKKYLQEQISLNNQEIKVYEDQIKAYGTATDTLTDETIASIRAKMVALKEENNEYQEQLNNAATDHAAEVAEEIKKKSEKITDPLQRALEMADLKYENWVASYPNAKQSVKHARLFDHLNEELDLLKKQEEETRTKFNEINKLSNSDSEEYKSAYEDWVRARVNRFNKEEEISNAHEQHLQELEEAEDRVRETEYDLWLSRNRNASEQEKLAEELKYLNESLVDAEEESAKLEAEYREIVEREGEDAEATKTALANWNESSKKAADLRNSINDNKQASLEAVEAASDRVRETDYDLWVAQNGNASDREKLSKELAYIEESIVDANEDVVKAEEAYNKAIADSNTNETERNNLLADLNEKRLVSANLLRDKKDVEESILALVEEERTIASDIAKIKYDIWENTAGRDAKDEEKELKQLEYLNEQLLIQNQITNKSLTDYNEAINDHGSDSTEAVRAYRSYLEEVRSLSELKNQILDIEESAADRQKRLRDKQDLAQTEYEDYIKRYEKYYLANGMSKADLEKDAKLVSGYDPAKVINNINKKAQSALGSIATSASYQNVLTGCSNMGSSYVQAINEGISSKTNDIATTMTDIVMQSVHKIVETRPFWIAAGKQLVGGLINGVISRQSEAINAAYKVAYSMLVAAKKALDINSPSKAFAEIGEYSILGLVKGLVDNTKLSDEAAARVGNSAIESMKDSIRKISDVINSDLDTQPTIRPVLDLSHIRSGTARLNAMVSNSKALAISDSRKAREHSDTNQNGNDTSTNTGNTYQFTQNNYSPKALSPTEIYRQTKNQFAAMKEVLS